jgi:hypothetical protein
VNLAHAIWQDVEARGGVLGARRGYIGPLTILNPYCLGLNFNGTFKDTGGLVMIWGTYRLF